MRQDYAIFNHFYFPQIRNLLLQDLLCKNLNVGSGGHIQSHGHDNHMRQISSTELEVPFHVNKIILY